MFNCLPVADVTASRIGVINFLLKFSQCFNTLRQICCSAAPIVSVSWLTVARPPIYTPARATNLSMFHRHLWIWQVNCGTIADRHFSIRTRPDDTGIRMCWQRRAGGHLTASRHSARPRHCPIAGATPRKERCFKYPSGSTRIDAFFISRRRPEAAWRCIGVPHHFSIRNETTAARSAH